MPPEYPFPFPLGEDTFLPSPQSVLYNLLRPSFVSRFSEPLCSNALMGWIKDDPQKEKLDAGVQKATEHLFEVAIPEFAKFLVRDFF
jgi:hypothetical protein